MYHNGARGCERWTVSWYAPDAPQLVGPRVTLLLGCWALLGEPAAAQEADPGTRLILEKDDGPARLQMSEVEEPEVVYPKEGISIGVRGRYTTIHDALFDVWLLNHTSYNGYSVGMELGLDGPVGGRVVLGLDWTDLSMPAGNWRGDRALPVDASYTEVDLGLVTLDATFLWRLRLAETFGFSYGLGIGLGYVTGGVTSIDVLPTCTEPSQVPTCPHWREVTKREQQVPPEEFPTRVIPLLNLQAGLYVLPAEGWQIRADVGYRLAVFYTGLAVRSAF